MLQVLQRVQNVDPRTCCNLISVPHAVCDSQLPPSVCSAPFSISQILAGKEATRSVDCFWATDELADMWMVALYWWTKWNERTSSYRNTTYASAQMLIWVYPLYPEIPKCERNLLFMQLLNDIICAWKFPRGPVLMREGRNIQTGAQYDTQASLSQEAEIKSGVNFNVVMFQKV